MLYISLLLALLAVACLIFVPNTVILLSFVAIMHGFAVYSACHALLHKRDSRAALGWIAIILFMPPVGCRCTGCSGSPGSTAKPSGLWKKPPRKSWAALWTCTANH